MAATLIAVALVLGVLLASLWPLLAQGSGPAAGDGLRSESAPGANAARLERRRDELVVALRDLDLDLAMGKLTPADHAEMRRSTELEALSVLEALDLAGDPDAKGSGAEA